MSCECYQIGGRFIAEDPDCPAHGTMAQIEASEREEEIRVLENKIARFERETNAWRSMFKTMKYSIEHDRIVQLSS